MWSVFKPRCVSLLRVTYILFTSFIFKINEMNINLVSTYLKKDPSQSNIYKIRNTKYVRNTVDELTSYDFTLMFFVFIIIVKHVNFVCILILYTVVFSCVFSFYILLLLCFLFYSLTLICQYSRNMVSILPYYDKIETN